MVSLMRSMKTMPGSPVAQAESTMELKISRAFTVPAASPVRGFFRS